MTETGVPPSTAKRRPGILPLALAVAWFLVYLALFLYPCFWEVRHLNVYAMVPFAWAAAGLVLALVLFVMAMGTSPRSVPVLRALAVLALSILPCLGVYQRWEDRQLSLRWPAAKASYEALMSRVQKEPLPAEPQVGEQADGLRYVVFPGKPLRFGFYWRGTGSIDFPQAVVFDPSDQLAPFVGEKPYDAARAPELKAVVEHFAKGLRSCRRVEGHYYFCEFTYSP